MIRKFKFLPLWAKIASIVLVVLALAFLAFFIYVKFFWKLDLSGMKMNINLSSMERSLSKAFQKDSIENVTDTLRRTNWNLRLSLDSLKEINFESFRMPLNLNGLSRLNDLHDILEAVSPVDTTNLLTD